MAAVTGQHRPILFGKLADDIHETSRIVVGVLCLEQGVLSPPLANQTITMLHAANILDLANLESCLPPTGNSRQLQGIRSFTWSQEN
jgi:hypothetical protein